MYTSRDFKGSVHKPWAAVGAWFLGPKAENGDLFGDLVKSSVDSHILFRKTYFPFDPSYVTREVKDTESYKKTVEFLRKEVVKMQEQLMKSVPFFSSRYKVSTIHGLPVRFFNCIKRRLLSTGIYLLFFVFFRDYFLRCNGLISRDFFPTKFILLENERFLRIVS